MSTDDTIPRREIKSFVKRIGRITAGQKLALEIQWPRYGLDYTGAPRDLAAIFGNDRPIVLEIGFGNGEALFAAAKADPERNYVGIEVHEPGVGRLLRDADAAGLANLRVSKHDAVEVLRHEIAPGSLAEVRLYFPDPWHKKRHHKRRIVQPDFVALIARKLAPGGYFHCATDWEDYAHWMLGILSAEPALENTADDFAPRPEHRPLTKFENRGLKLGHGVWDLVFRRRAG